MEDLQRLLDANARWARRKVEDDPEFFRRLVRQQTPDYLWIGCSDSRVPANEIVDLPPGELFVHRNIANVAAVDDRNCQAVIEFAVEQLRVRHIMVVGHYGCSGVQAALDNRAPGCCTQDWLGQVRAVARRHQALLDDEPAGPRRSAMLCELNVLEQALQVCEAPAVLRAWERGQALSVHGWIYHLEDGLLRHLDFSIDAPGDSDPLRQRALAAILAAREAAQAQPA